MRIFVKQNFNPSFMELKLSRWIKLWIGLLCISSYQALGQPSQSASFLGQDTTRRVINTSVPFLNISPDARAAGMGDVGVATAPDVNATHWNPAKLVFIPNRSGFALSYSPWLRQFVNDMSISYLSGFYQIDNKQAIGGSLRYFNLGNIQFTDGSGNLIRDFMPREVAFDASYSRKLSDKLSLAVTARYIHSNLSADLLIGNQVETRPINSGSVDISMFYQSNDIDFFGMRSKIAWGFNISNIGPKVSYSNNRNNDFIPTNLRLGGAFTVKIDEFNRFTWALDLNKLLVPTPPQINSQGQIIRGDDPRNLTVIQGMWAGLTYAPGGFSEKMQELMIATGLEYWYSDKFGSDLFSARLGYFHEDRNKGNRRYFSVGLGFRYNVFGLDVAYIIPVVQNNPLAETLRFSLIFNFKEKSAANNPDQD